jgi:cation transport ATPase
VCVCESVCLALTLALPVLFFGSQFPSPPHSSSSLLPPGVHAVVEGSLVAVGKRDWVERLVGPSGSSGSGSSSPGSSGSGGRHASPSEPGSSLVWVGVEGRGLLGCLEMKDVLRADARETAQKLREMGLR